MNLNARTASRLVAVSAPSGYSATNYFNNQGLIGAVSNALGQVSAVRYDILDRATNVTDADGISMSATFDVLGRLVKWTYPDGGEEKFGYTLNVPGVTAYTNQLTNIVLYGYDEARRRTNESILTISTNGFTDDASGNVLTLTDGRNQITTWHYDVYGRATNKVDALGREVFRYAYDGNGRLTNRWSAQKGNTVFRYDAVGNLTNVDYPNSADISLAYDVLGRLTNMVDAAGTSRYAYDSVGQLLSEDGPWPEDTVSYSYANRRLAGLSLSQPSASPWTQSYGYDSIARLTTILSPAGTFGYDYNIGQGASPASLLRKLTLPSGAYITNEFDTVGRLLATTLKNSQHSTLNAHQYTYNVGGQRTRQTRTEGSFEDYAYDAASQLVAAKAKEPGGTTNRLHEQFSYGYDAAGNLNWRTNHALVQQFQVDSVNQLTNVGRTGGSTLTVAGTTGAPATNVTVNDLMATLYADCTFAKDGFALADGTNTFTAVAADALGRTDTNTAISYLPASLSLAYDLNGNLTNDGRRVFFYEDENQLTTVLVSNAWKSEFTYNGVMRRRVRKEYAWQGSACLLTHEVRYVYDGNLVLQERDASNLPLVTYTRGLDLSGSLEGAGGIGGLLARTVNTLLQAPGSALLAHAYYHADGNGNITCLLNSTQQVAARYLYGPFGDTLSASGLLADANTYRFSSQDFHRTSGLIHFLRRFYEPAMQRWITQDPLDMSAGPNLYLYTANTPINAIDPRGQQVVPVRQWDPTRGIWIEVMPPTIVYGDGPIIVGWWGSGDRFVPGARQDTRPNGASREPGTGQGERPKARLVDCRTAGGSQHLVHPNLAVAQAMQDLAGGLAEVIGGFIPYVGDMLDARDVVSPSSSALDRSLGGASLTLNAATAGVLPNYGPIRRGIGRIVSGLTGQNHHAISMTIWRALDQHPGTSGHFVPRDGRFVTQAADLASHNGYDTWHRTYDNNVAQSILAQAELTPEQFTQYLRELYKTDPELCRRFPNGL